MRRFFSKSAKIATVPADLSPKMVPDFPPENFNLLSVQEMQSLNRLVSVYEILGEGMYNKEKTNDFIQDLNLDFKNNISRYIGLLDQVRSDVFNNWNMRVIHAEPADGFMSRPTNKQFKNIIIAKKEEINRDLESYEKEMESKIEICEEYLRNNFDFMQVKKKFEIDLYNSRNLFNKFNSVGGELKDDAPQEVREHFDANREIYNRIMLLQDTRMQTPSNNKEDSANVPIVPPLDLHKVTPPYLC